MNPITAFWMLVSVIGVVLSAYLMTQSILDLKAMTGKAYGKRDAGRSRLMRETVRFCLHLFYLFTGLQFLFVEFGFSRVVFLLLISNMAMILNSLLDVFWIRRTPVGLRFFRFRGR